MQPSQPVNPFEDDPPTTRLPRITLPLAEPPAAAAQTAPAAPAPEPAPPRRKRSRSTLLLAAAALLGIVGGACFGYVEQAGEDAAPLPPLSQSGLAYPKERLAKGEEEKLSAKEDRRVKTAGDLRKLLIEMPKGASDDDLSVGQDGWVAPYELANDSGDAKFYFEELMADGFRRAAERTWKQPDGQFALVRLLQFRDDQEAGAEAYLSLEKSGLAYTGQPGDTDIALPGSANGRIYIPKQPAYEDGYEPFYTGAAIARRGDIVMMILMFNNGSPVSKQTLTAHAKRQLERL